MRDGAVLVDGERRAKSHRLEGGEELEVILPEPAVLEASEHSLDVVLEDEHLVVVDKPAGLVVHPAAGHEGETLVHRLVGLGAAWMAWRTSYFGHLLPNVFYAKHSARHELADYLAIGWRYVSNFLLFRDDLLQCIPPPWSTAAAAALLLLALVGLAARRGVLLRIGAFLALFPAAA